MKIYLVKAWSGYYDCDSSWHVRAFVSQNQADALVEEANKVEQRILERSKKVRVRSQDTYDFYIKHQYSEEIALRDSIKSDEFVNRCKNPYDPHRREMVSFGSIAFYNVKEVELEIPEAY